MESFEISMVSTVLMRAGLLVSGRTALGFKSGESALTGTVSDSVKESRKCFGR